MPPLVWDGRGLQPGFKAHKERGIGRYAKNLLAAMLPLVDPARVRVLIQANLPDPELPPGLERLPAPYAPAWLPIGKRILSHHLLARAALAPAWRQGAVAHFLSHLDAPAFINPASVLTVHDLIAQRLEKLYRAGKGSWRFRLERALETRCLYQARRIITPSQQTKDDLVELYGIEPARIRVIPEAADPGLAPVSDPALIQAVLARLGLSPERPFFLYLGGIDQRKGLSTLLTALASLRRDGRPHDLVLAGRIDQDKQYPALRQAVEQMGLAPSVRELGFVADADLPALFAAATAFVFPSLYEGFGLPPLEAMACGAPVVASRASSIPEVVGQAGILVPPGDAQALAQALEALGRLPELGAELREKGFRQAALFSWQRAAQATLALYEEVASERAGRH